MRRSRSSGATLVALALAASACARTSPAPVTPTEGDRFFVAGYHAAWTGSAWEQYPWNVLDEVYFFEIYAGADGAIVDAQGWPERWQPLIDRARFEGTRLVPTVSLHDAEAFEQLFSDSLRWVRLVDELSALLSATPGLGGLHLDFEVFQPVQPASRSGFTDFVARLESRMDEVDPASLLSTFTLAFDDDDVYDEPALGEIADFLVVQGYDFHSKGERRAGPVAALSGWGRLNWQTVVDRFLGFGVPARKIVMAVPLYGYEWPVTSGEPGADTRAEAIEIPLTPNPGVVPEMPRAFSQAAIHGLRRDDTSGSPYYVFQDSVGWRQGWFEDAESLRAKYEFVREHGLGGVALFPLAYGSEALWADLRASFRRRRSR